MACTSVLILFSLAATLHAVNVDSRVGRGAVGSEQERSLLQTYNKQLSGGTAKDTPVTRVVNLLKEMSKTLNKEMEEDEELYKQLSCWCNNGKYEKTQAIDAATAKISDLEATIEELTARSKELKAKIAELEAEVKADKEALATATALREKQLKEFHAMELDNIEALENLKAALVVLGRHHGAAFPQMPMSFLEIDSKQEPWEAKELSHSFDDFMRHSGMSETPASGKFLQEAAPLAKSAPVGDWSSSDISTVKLAYKKANAFIQAHHEYYPSYAAQSGEIVGVLKQLQDEMKAGLAEAQKTEANRAALFAELRKAKTDEIEAGEKMAEQKEDQLAKADMDNAEAKEDLGQTQEQLAADQKFLANLEKMCAEGNDGFEKRKASRLEEIKAVAETIEILTGDEARDAMDTTFSFVQKSTKTTDKRRIDAAAVLRKVHSPELAMLATSVELDAFTKVKAMIDKMIETLKTQQADEVKKNDWCNSELQENEMSTMKTKSHKEDLEAKIGELEATIKRLSEEIEQAHLDIDNAHVQLQRASEDRKKENLDFQKVVADQTVTAEILEKALDRLATFYDEAAFAQTHTKSTKYAAMLVQMRKQTPPVAQMTYTKSAGASGVMSMIEKLIYDTKDITAKSKKSEQEAQAGYEALIADTNANVLALTEAITTKTKEKAQAKKDLALTQEDHADAVEELEELAKYNADLHAECDYIMKNFMIRQQGRAEEIEALQQAKQILNGANLS